MTRICRLALLALFLVASARADIVINEIFAGGSNSGAPFNQDYVELFNNGATAINIGGWLVQYEAAAATGSFQQIAIIPDNTFLAAGDFYTITAGPVPAGAQGANVPRDFAGANVALSIAGGKVQLLDNSPTRISIDFVGYGGANQSETAPAPAMTNTTSIQRIANGFDSNNNSTDFQVLSPTPDAFNVVPEPSTYMLLGVGLLFCAQRFLRRRDA